MFLGYYFFFLKFQLVPLKFHTRLWTSTPQICIWLTFDLKIKRNFSIVNPMKLILVPNSVFLSMIDSLVHFKIRSAVTWLNIQYGRHPKEPKLNTRIAVVLLSSGMWSWCLLQCFWVWSIHLCISKCTQRLHDLKSNMATTKHGKNHKQCWLWYYWAQETDLGV